MGSIPTPFPGQRPYYGRRKGEVCFNFFSFNGQLDLVFNIKSEDFYLVLLIAFMDEQQEDSRAVALFSDDNQFCSNLS
jgi:hypothetical protein